MAGVDIDEGNRAVAQMKAAVERTHGAEVVRGVGSFGGVFAAKALTTMDDPVLVATNDGVGTKVELGRPRGGCAGWHDIVNHCVNDALVQGARPLFFLDYFAASTLDADLVPEVVGGMGAACEAAGARCSAARRPRCRASTRPARSTSPARWSASPSAPLLPRPTSPRATR